MTVAALGEPMPKLTIVRPSELVAEGMGLLRPRMRQSNISANRFT